MEEFTSLIHSIPKAIRLPKQQSKQRRKLGKKGYGIEREREKKRGRNVRGHKLRDLCVN